MVTGALRNGAKKMTRNTSRRKMAYVVPLHRQLRKFEQIIDVLDEQANIAVNEKNVFRCLIADALDIDDPKLRDHYLKLTSEYESFGIDRGEIQTIFREFVYELEDVFRKFGVVRGPRYDFSWLPRTRNVFIYEEE